MIEDLVNEAMSIMDSLRIFSIRPETIDSVMQNQVIDFDEEFESIINESTENLKKVERFIEIMSALRGHEDQDEFWDEVSSQDKSPGIFQPFCYGLMEKTGKPKVVGVILYVTLLGLHPLNLIWNSRIFNNIFSILVAASQAVESMNVINAEEKYCISLTAKILKSLSYALTSSFCRLAGTDVVIALIEISVKMVTIYRRELEKFSLKLAPAAIQFLDAASETSIDLILPFLVLALILDFLPSSKTITAKVASIRELLLKFVERQLSDTPEKIVLIIKHIFSRSSERVQLKENAAVCIRHLLKMIDDRSAIFTFFLRAAKSSKSSQRSLALDIFKLLLSEERGILTEDLENQMVESMIFGINDITPSVRSSAITSITALVSKASDNVMKTIFSETTGLIRHLEKRICDEKLNVRKAALKLAKVLINVKDQPDFSIFSMIANRIRDRSPLMRQEAATTLSLCLPDFQYPEKLIKLWFDQILPLALDTDGRTQILALRLIDSHFLQPMVTEVGIKMAKCITEEFKDLLVKVFFVYKQKAINLHPFCLNLQKKLDYDCEPVLWTLADVLISVTPDHFKKDFTAFWDKRDNLPHEYFSVIAKLNLASEQIIKDSLDYVLNIAKGLIDIDDRRATFALMDAYVKILRSQNSSPEIVDQIQYIVSIIVTTLNNTISNSLAKEYDLYVLVPIVYIIGDLIELLHNFNDYDFTGLQVLIGEQLPNETKIPPRVRAVATISVGKLCLGRKEVTNSFVAAFAHVLHNSTDGAVKCNSLIVLCDLCVKYSATVDSYVMDMSACFADASVIVRRQSLLIMTRLIAEDYVKMRPLLFFRYIYAIVDDDKLVSKFAQSCLFNVVNAKNPILLSQHFIDSLFYFNDHISIDSLGEDQKYHANFRIIDRHKRIKAYKMMISHMNSTTLFELLQASCIRALQSFLDGSIELEEGESLLSDTFVVMLMIEDEMEAVNVSEANNDDPKEQAVLEQNRLCLDFIHNSLIKSVLPTLNQMHRFLRDMKSPLQSELRSFFRKLCQKHPSLLEELQRQEPILAAELSHDISMTQTPDLSQSSIPSSPISRTPFRSPLLSKIARTPLLTTVALSGNTSPLSVLSQIDSSQIDSSQVEPPQIEQSPVDQSMLDQSLLDFANANKDNVSDENINDESNNNNNNNKDDGNIKKGEPKKKKGQNTVSFKRPPLIPFILDE